MCYHIIQSKLAKQIERRFKASFLEPNLFQPTNHLNGFDFPKAPIITAENPEVIAHYNWGLIPNWSKNQDIRALTLNAKIETLSEKPSFKNILQQRCLVLANGFYEWQWLDVKGKNKVKYQIGIADEALFAFAGLYSYWKNERTSEIVRTFTIVTTEANTLMAKIHTIKKRMPIILQPEDEQNWLQMGNVEKFAFPYQVDLVAQKTEVAGNAWRLF
jgi:putative SOS response-associated peptidase YedK